MQEALPNGLYAHPFSKAYWRDAAKEFRSTRMLVFAALMIALRVICKPLSIQVGPMLSIPIAAMLVNALGAMAFGPVVAIPAALISDTLGFLVYPNGVFFPLYALTEIAGSVIFALFLYRTRVNVWRVLLARFCIDIIVNIALQTPINYLYYSIALSKAYEGLLLIHVIKELAMFPVETVIIAIFLRFAVPPLHAQGYVKSDTGDLRFSTKTVLTLVCLTLVGAGAVFGYTVHTYNTTSLTDSFDKRARTENNLLMREIALENDETLSAEITVAVIQSAYPCFGSPNITYTVDIYQLDREKLAARVYPADHKRAGQSRNERVLDVHGYSATSASSAVNDGALVYCYSLKIVTGEGTKIISYERIPENQ